MPEVDRVYHKKSHNNLKEKEEKNSCYNLSPNKFQERSGNQGKMKYRRLLSKILTF